MADQDCRRPIALLGITGTSFFLIALGLLVAALFMPLDADLNPTVQDRAFGRMTLSTLDQDKFTRLSSKARGRLLIKAAQSQAAVKDNGLAATLAKSLRLQGNR